MFNPSKLFRTPADLFVCQKRSAVLWQRLFLQQILILVSKSGRLFPLKKDEIPERKFSKNGKLRLERLSSRFLCTAGGGVKGKTFTVDGGDVIKMGGLFSRLWYFFRNYRRR